MFDNVIWFTDVIATISTSIFYILYLINSQLKGQNGQNGQNGYEGKGGQGGAGGKGNFNNYIFCDFLVKLIMLECELFDICLFV